MQYYHQRHHWRNVAAISALCFIFICVASQWPLVAQTALKRTGRKTTPAKTRKVPVPTPANTASAELSGWVLKFADEFDSATLNYSKWSPHPPGNIRLSGLQTWLPDAISLSNGQAHIVASPSGTSYTSGVMSTLGTFAQTFGRFEIRFRIPAGRGLEPRFRLLPIPLAETPAIDVLDVAGGEPDRAIFTNTWGDTRTDREYGGSYQVGNLSSGFHTAAIEWDAEQIVWFVDGVERFHSLDGVPHQPMFLEVSLAVGSDRAGAPDRQTKFPAVFDIDYIRVFSRP